MYTRLVLHNGQYFVLLLMTHFSIVYSVLGVYPGLGIIIIQVAQAQVSWIHDV